MEYDCCFSSEAACFRQYGYFPGQAYCPFFKWCATEYKIPRSKCVTSICVIRFGDISMADSITRTLTVALFPLALDVDVLANDRNIFRTRED